MNTKEKKKLQMLRDKKLLLQQRIKGLKEQDDGDGMLEDSQKQLLSLENLIESLKKNQK